MLKERRNFAYKVVLAITQHAVFLDAWEAGPCIWHHAGSLAFWLPVQCGQWKH